MWGIYVMNSMRCLFGHRSHLLWFLFFSLWSSLLKLWCIFNDFDLFFLCSFVASVIFMCIFGVYALFLFIYICSLMPWISWVIMLSTMPFCCPWKHIHNHSSLHSDLWSGKHCHYTYAICSFFRMSPITFLFGLCAWTPCNAKNSSPQSRLMRSCSQLGQFF